MTYLCPHCLETKGTRSNLRETSPRVFTCPSCKTKYPFNDLSGYYDKLQQSLFATLSDLGERKREVVRQLKSLRENPSNTKTYQTKSSSLTEESSSLDTQISDSSHLQLEISAFLTSSYSLYEEPKEDSADYE